MAQGVFDIIHPGHIHYLEKSAELGDKLTVIIARDQRLERETYFTEEERRQIVQALKPVDKAKLGSKENIYKTVSKTDPDIITLGHDQEHDKKQVKKTAEDATGHKVQIKRISGLKDYSSSKIKESHR